MARMPGLFVPPVFISVLVVVAAAVLFLMSHQETEAVAANRFEINPAAKNIGLGSSTSVQLVADPGDDSLAVWVVEIAYDPAVVSFNSCTSTGEAQVTACEAKDADDDTVDDTVVSVGAILFSDTLRGLDSETALATVKFNAVGAVEQCSLLTIDVTANLGPDPDTQETDPVVVNGQLCIVEDAGVDRIWGDVDCDGTVGTRDSQALLRNVLEQPPLSQTGDCPAIGAPVTVDGNDGVWGDVDCDGTVGTRDSQALLRNVLEQPALSQTSPCPLIGVLAQVAD